MQDKDASETDSQGYLVNTAGTTASAVVTAGIDASWAWWNHTYPDFVPLASGRAGDCNIFGPLCQTGTVTVGVKINNSTTTTTVAPCSLYLSQQAKSLAPSWGLFEPWQYEILVWEDVYFGPGTSVWLSSFGHSPECTSFAAIEAAFTSATQPLGPITSAAVLSGCPSNDTGLLGPWKAYTPPAVENQHGHDFFSCCGWCTLHVPRVRVIYFPDAFASSCSQGPGFYSSAYDNMTRAPSTPASNEFVPVTAVESGYTL